MNGVEILRVEWQRVRAACPDVPDRELAERLLERARRVLDRPFEERVPDDLPPAQRVDRLRTLLARKAASVAVHRFELIAVRERFAHAEEEERVSYERHLELEKDIVPPLKLEAKALRAELRRLEAEARDLGINVESVEPRVDWPNTLAVDAYQPPRYETNESRRRTAVDFFGRIGG
jgi:hypothetical protein